MGHPIDADRIVAFLEEHLEDPPLATAPILVRYSLYQGLIDRIRNGDFDQEKGTTDG